MGPFPLAKTCQLEHISFGSQITTPLRGRRKVILAHLERHIREIPLLVERLFNLLGIEDCESSQHRILKSLEEYERWLFLETAITPTTPPTSVLELANLALVVDAIQRKRPSKNLLKHLRGRLSAHDAANFGGIFFELRTVLHYMPQYPYVDWRGYAHGEADVVVRTDSGETIYVECSRFMKKDARQVDLETLKKDIQAKLSDKARQLHRREEHLGGHPVLVALYVPETIQKLVAASRPKLEKCAQLTFEENNYRYITGVVLVAYKPPIMSADHWRQIYDTDLSCCLYQINRKALFSFPNDFRPILIPREGVDEDCLC